MKKKIVLMKSVEHDYETITILNGDRDVPFWSDKYAQLSEVVEVDFKDLSDEVIVKNQVDIIDKQITKIMADSEASITALNGRKQELLALPSL